MKFFFTLLAFFFVVNINAQDEDLPKYVSRTFKDTRIINVHSVETIKKRKLDVRIGHRFGDLVGDAGGWGTFYGLEQAADVLIGAEYGISDNLMIGLHRTKGAGKLTALINTSIKYRFLQQGYKGGMPVSMAVLGLATTSTRKRVDDPESFYYFDNFSHRMVYALQLMIARKFSDGISLQITPSYIHRNLVTLEDENGLFSLGFAGRFQLNKVFGIIIDTTIPFSSLRNSDNGYYIPLGFGLEIDTGGHLFQINFTNAKGIVETDYIPYSQANWGDGQFRLGFTISRTFNL